MDAGILAFNPQAGQAETLQAGLRRVLAPNPSPMTFRGTNTYLIGTREIAVIDPGPDDSAHLNAILAALDAAQSISHIFVTHAHLDHSPLAARLADVTGAPILAFGGPHSGRSPVMQDLAQRGLAGGGEGVDESFAPTQIIKDGDIVHGDGWALEALHTPGHFGNHLSFAWEDVCFCGDHVMGWASSLVSPPDGDLTDFMESCRKLLSRTWRVFHAGHGAPIESPSERLKWLMAHRLGRESQILEDLSRAPSGASELAARIYTETPPPLMPAATRNVFAHLVDLYGKKIVTAQGELSANAIFERL